MTIVATDMPSAAPTQSPDTTDVSPRVPVASAAAPSIDITIVAAGQPRPTDEDRRRIAVGVNDTVIRHLFSIGLDLHTTRALSSETVQSRLDSTIHELDAAIRELRSLIFDLERDD